ncbi:MAG: type I glyceraldehyde-3-phosphate dehydrogenase [Gammaproteobacteria bacterium]|nr:MAG: type I glyceraldehyde-3-phosphate dehydrogenase [Gammaproteobacteria bacterium]
MAKSNVAINGFGRMGRLALREAMTGQHYQVTHINETGCDVNTAAHLLKYDSVHGTWPASVEVIGENSLAINGKKISYTSNLRLEETPWANLGIDIAVDCTGAHKSQEKLNAYLQQGVKKVVVSAPVKDGSLNIVVGVNDHLYRTDKHNIVTAASCTTNCLAPVVKVIHENLGIVHGSMTTIHDITNTQRILDQPHNDLRRARASSLSLIPTTTGSATAIGLIFPELQGKLNGIAVRVPLANASLTDCVFEVAKNTSVAEVNQLLKTASKQSLKGILGYEETPLVSVDYRGDRRSGIVDALSTMVIDNRQVKMLVWYDNEIGYVNRMMELTNKVAREL